MSTRRVVACGRVVALGWLALALALVASGHVRHPAILIHMAILSIGAVVLTTARD